MAVAMIYPDGEKGGRGKLSQNSEGLTRTDLLTAIQIIKGENKEKRDFVLVCGQNKGCVCVCLKKE